MHDLCYCGSAFTGHMMRAWWTSGGGSNGGRPRNQFPSPAWLPFAVGVIATWFTVGDTNTREPGCCVSPKCNSGGLQLRGA
jgi:hypothetical protein